MSVADYGQRTTDHRLRKKSRVVGKRRGIVAGIWGAAGDPTTQGVFREVPGLGNRLCEGPSLFSAGPIACCIRRDELEQALCQMLPQSAFDPQPLSHLAVESLR